MRRGAVVVVGRPAWRALSLRVMVLIALVGFQGSTLAGQKTLVVGAGDCKDSVVLGTVKDFQDLARGLLRGELIEQEEALAAVRPQPTRSLEDLARQVESARSLLFNAQNERAAEVVNDALAGLERASPQVHPWPTTTKALMLSAQISKNLDLGRNSNEAFRRILRVEPNYRADPDAWPPSTIRALDAVRKELQRSKMGVLQVSSLERSTASVFLDGREMGKTPLRLELPQGTYRLSLLAQDAVSFPRVVNVGREESVQVDLGFEGSLAATVPLCLTGEDPGALKLASTVGASRVVVLRNASPPGNPPYVSGVLYEVDTGDRVRNAGIRPQQLRDLMKYLFTGQPDISKEPPPLAPAVPLASSVEASSVSGHASAVPFPRLAAYGMVGLGVAVAAVGIVLFAAAGTPMVDEYQNVAVLDAPRVAMMQRNQSVGVGLIAAGAAVGLAGAIWWFLLPAESRVTLSWWPGGGAVVAGGVWP